jgi:hypothetical protein
MDSQTVKRVTGIAPIVMSLLALAVVIEGMVEFGKHPPTDEGWQAHIFQVLMVAQVPVILLFIVTSWQSLKKSLPVLGAQVFFWALAVATLGAWEFLYLR